MVARRKDDAVIQRAGIRRAFQLAVNQKTHLRDRALAILNRTFNMELELTGMRFDSLLRRAGAAAWHESGALRCNTNYRRHDMRKAEWAIRDRNAVNCPRSTRNGAKVNVDAGWQIIRDEIELIWQRLPCQRLRRHVAIIVNRQVAPATFVERIRARLDTNRPTIWQVGDFRDKIEVGKPASGRHRHIDRVEARLRAREVERTNRIRDRIVEPFRTGDCTEPDAAALRIVVRV